VNGISLSCPVCRAPARAGETCACGFRLVWDGGILRALPEERRRRFAKFLSDYGTVRRAEGRGSADADYYRTLPYADSAQWRIRAKTFEYFRNRLLPAAKSKVLDLGSGNGWFSHKLSGLGHEPVSVDIFTDALDGLEAALRYSKVTLVEAEFDRLPFAGAQFDLAVFNASLHYSPDYQRTLAEVRRCVRPTGRIFILDSPLYKAREHGELMQAERRAQFQQMYGFPSDSLSSREFLYEAQLGELASAVGLRWRIHQPWYGVAWHLRPLRARLARRRPPSRFCILEAELLAA
jgi:SAM-dependent methyltransferase